MKEATGPVNPKVGYNQHLIPDKNILVGKPIELKMPNGETRRGAFAIVDISDLKASHNEETFSNTEGYPLDENHENINDRNYKDDPNSQAKVIEFAQNLEPDRLVVTSRTPSGTPIITTDGIVVSGNNRTMSLKLAVKQFPDKYREYLEFLRDEISSFGYKDQIGTQLLLGERISVEGSSFHDPKYVQFIHPVLVRIDYDFPDYNTLELSKYNKETKKAERPIDKAIKLGKIVSANDRCRNVIAEIVSKYETFTEFYANLADQRLMKDTLINCNVLTTQEIPAYFYERGFTDQGKELIENILAGMVLSKDALVASNEGGARTFRQTIITSLPVLTANLNLGEYSLNDVLNEAVLMQANMSATKLSFKDYLAQGNMFGEPASQWAMYMNRLLAGGRNKFKGSIEGYNTGVESSQGATMFGDAPTKDEVFTVYIKNKIDAEDKALIERYALPAAEEKKPEPKTETKMSNPFINGNYFAENPDKVLAQTHSGTDRWKKPVTLYKGSLEDLARIDAQENFLEATKVEQPTISVVDQSVFEASNSNGEVVANLQNAIAKSKSDEFAKVKRKQKRKQEVTSVAQADSDSYTVKEVYDMINPEISIDELRAFLWYKNSVGRPITNPDWIALTGMSESELYSDQSLQKWLDKGLLYYFEGKLIPAYLYLAENVYDKQNRLVPATENSKTSGQDKDYIIEKYGQAVYDNQVSALHTVFKEQYEKRLIIQGEGSDSGLVISPVSKFAKEFKINTLVDGQPFKWKKITAPSNKRYGLPDYLATGVLDRDKVEFENLSLTEAFCYWLRMDETIQFKKGMNYSEVITVYIQAKSKPASNAKKDDDGRYHGDQLRIKKAEDSAWERKKSKAKEEADRLFMIFLANQLTLNDKVTIETQWNRQFNGYVPINYNKVPVAFRCNRFDMGKPMEIKPEKREAVAFTFSEGSGLLAYDVGVGKTPSAIFTVCQFIDTGYAKRPVIVVPNQTYKQWISEFKKFAAHIPINEFYNLSESYLSDWQDTHGATRMVPEGSVSIMTYEGMKQMGFSKHIEDILKPELGSILLQESTGKKSDKQRDREAEKLNTAVENLIGTALSRTVVNIDQLGFDFISFDEAHACKKVFTFVKGEKEENLGNSGKDTKTVNRYEIKSGAPSFNGVKGFMLCQYIQRNFQGNTLLLTATPFTNSPLEIYSMLAMIAHNRLKEMELDNLSTFFDTFIATSYEMVINSRLKPERRQIILGFNNLISLQTLIRRFINYKTGEQVKVPRPNKIVLPLRTKMIDGLIVALGDDEKVETMLPLTPVQQELMAQIKEYADGNISEDILCSGSLVEEEENPDAAKAEGVEIDESSMDQDEKIGVRLLKAMNHARNLALSPYIFDCSGLGKPDHKSYIHTSNKLNFVMESIRTVKQYHENEKSDMSGIVVYMDRGVEYFPLIREYLIKEVGFAEHEVGIISSKVMMPIERGIAKEDQKEYVKNLFLGKKFNTTTLEMEDIPATERVKVLIGSSTIKEGINLQSHSSCLFNCWVDWNPTDIQQLEGRIWRQGNKFLDVRIINPLMIDSMDIFMFQKLEEKTSRINTIWQSDGRTNVLKTEDFNPKELKYSLIKDARVLAQMELMEESERIEEEIADLDNQIKRNTKIKQYDATIKAHTDDLAEWLEEYRPAEGRKRTLDAMIGLAQEVLKKQTDAQGKKMMASWQRDKTKPESFYSDLYPANKQYWFDDLNFSNRNLKREERDYLSPRGVKIDGLDKYSEKLKAKIEVLRKEKEKTTSDQAIETKAREINEYREANKIELKTVEQVVKDFEKLNYLLSRVKVSSVKEEPKTQCPPVDANGQVRTDAEALDILAECVKNDSDTKLLHTTQSVDEKGETIYTYTPERKKLHEAIVKDMISSAVCISQEKPIAILTGGSPASGKSTFLNKYAPYLKSDAIWHVDADKVREYFPEYKGWNSANTHMETRDVVNELLDSFDKPCKHDLLYDGTMTNARKYRSLIRRLRDLGYRIFIAFMEIPMEVALERSLSRYKNNKGGKTKYGRYVAPHIIKDFYATGRSEFDEIKNEVDGYIVVDSLTQQITERGGETIPQDRNYSKMFNGEPTPEKPAELTKKDYQDALAGAKVMLAATSGKEKKEWSDYIRGLKTMIELL